MTVAPLSLRARRLLEACDRLFPECTQSPSNRDVSTEGEPSSAAASQGKAAHVGTDGEMLASLEGPSIFSTATHWDSRSPGREGE